MNDLTDEEIAHLVEFGEARAVDDWLQALSPGMAKDWDVRSVQVGSATAWHVARLPHPNINRVIGLGLDIPATEAMIDALIDVYRPAQVPFAVHLSPAARPMEIATWLQARGFRRGRTWAKFYRGAEPLAAVPTALRIEQISTRQRDAFIHTYVAGFGGMPAELGILVGAAIGRTGWHYYLAYAGELPVAAAALYVGNEVASLIGAATLSTYRKQGAQNALIARRIQDAARLGCRWLVTETDENTLDKPNPSYRNMQRLGFTLAYLRSSYVFQWSP